jgi:hypothetical protein
LDRRYPETNNQLSTIDKKVSKEIEANKNVMSKSEQTLVNRNNLEMLLHILIQVHMRGQLSRDEQAFVRNFIELPEAPTRENRQARRANTQAIKKLFREEAKRKRDE